MLVARRLLGAALVAAVALAGCGGDGGGPLGGGLSGEPNATDAAFARAMAAHERTTGSIVELGSRRALRKELRRMSRETLGRHDRRLRELADAADDLRARGVSPVGGGIREPPPFDRRALRNAVSFDYDFLERMIRQHEYAVATAAAERARGGDTRLKALAHAIHESSRRDLAMLRRWMRLWYRPTQPNDPRVPPPGGGGGGAPAPEV